MNFQARKWKKRLTWGTGESVTMCVAEGNPSSTRMGAHLPSGDTNANVPLSNSRKLVTPSRVRKERTRVN